MWYVIINVMCGVVSWKWKRLTFVSREKISSSFRCLQKNTLDRELTYAVLNLSTRWQIIQIQFLIFHQSNPMHCKTRSKLVIHTMRPYLKSSRDIVFTLLHILLKLEGREGERLPPLQTDSINTFLIDLTPSRMISQSPSAIKVWFKVVKFLQSVWSRGHSLTRLQANFISRSRPSCSWLK